MQDPERVRAYFDGEAATYDRYTAGDGWTPNRVMADVLHELVAGGVRIGRVLDLGTGTGHTLAAVHDVAPGAELTGVDLSSEMLAHARRRLPAARLVREDLSEYVRRCTDSFDLVTAVGCSENIADLPQVLQTVAGLLCVDGHLALTVESSSNAPLGPDEVRSGGLPLLAAWPGFVAVHQSRFLAYHRREQAVYYELLVARRGT